MMYDACHCMDCVKASLDNIREVSIDYISSALGKVRVKIRCSIMQQRMQVGCNFLLLRLKTVFHHSPLYIQSKYLLKKRPFIFNPNQVGISLLRFSCMHTEKKKKANKTKRSSCSLTQTPQVCVEHVEEHYNPVESLIFNWLRDCNITLHLK